jgi:uracil-DNA glycosylase
VTRYRSLASLQRDCRRCRLCAEAGFPLESGPVFEGRAGQRAYILGQAPGVGEAVQEPKRGGRAVRTSPGPIDLGQEEWAAAFYCASVTRCDPGRAPSGRGDRTPTPRELALCRPWWEAELRLLEPSLVLAVGGLAVSALLGKGPLTERVGERFDLGASTVVPLPHPSGASGWLNAPANRLRLERALGLVRRELRRPGAGH